MPQRLPYKLIDSKAIFKGYRVTLFKDRFTLHRAPGKIVTREHVDHPGAVAVVPRFSKNKLLLIRQFRYSAKGDLWEIPAGTLELGEKPLTCAKRELEEETGYKAKKWRYLSRFYLAPGMSNEVMTLYEASDLVPGKLHLDHDEWIQTRAVSSSQALDMVRRGLVRDSKSILGILWVTQRVS